MQALILIGTRIDPDKGKVVENLYTGLDGAALQKAADDAAKSARYVTIHKLVHPAATPMPCREYVVKTTIPVFPRPKAAEEPARPEKNDLDKAQDELRAKRLAATIPKKPGEGTVSVSTPPPPGSEPLRDDGPTIEEWIAKGYDPKGYPPAGWNEKPSPGLTLYREKGVLPAVSADAEIDAEKARIAAALSAPDLDAAPGSTPAPVAPPVDNNHVEEGAEKFSEPAAAPAETQAPAEAPAAPAPAQTKTAGKKKA